MPAVKKRKLHNSTNDKSVLSTHISDNASEKSVVSKTVHNEVTLWNLEQNYETEPRKIRKTEKEYTRLPIKTVEGLVQQLQVINDDKEVETDLKCSSSELSSHESVIDDKEPTMSVSEQVLKAQEDLAKTAILLRDNDPEEHAGAFKTLAQIGQSSNHTIKKFALITQLAVYKDIIPAYHIRPLSDEDKATKVSKEVKRLRTYEQELVTGYRRYVLDLAKYVHSADKITLGDKETDLASLAISCACTLLVSVPHFNFRGDLIKILVGKLSSRKVDADFIKCRDTVERLFREDEHGGPSLDAVTSLTKMMKEKGYRVDESVINLFLHLRLLTEFSYKGSVNHVDRKRIDGSSDKRPKVVKTFRTKKEKKLMRERKVIEQEMKVTDAIVSRDEKDRMQAETLKLIFLTYFRILKLRSSNLMGAVLEGLASYAHLINQEFFGDLLEALKDLITHTNLGVDTEKLDLESREVNRNTIREALLCIITAFVLLEGQDAVKAKNSLNLDLSFFIAYLYEILHIACLDPNIEVNTKRIHATYPVKILSSTQSSGKINFQTTTVLLLRSISSLLLPPLATRAVPPLRIAAFTKQLLTSCIQLPEKSCTVMITLIGKVTKIHEKKIASLWNTDERLGDGHFNALSTELEGSNPFASTIWEGELLRKHFSPAVRNGIKQVEKNIIGLR